jgi:hypothetical protein
MQKKKLSHIQKKRIVQWEIPHLLEVLKKEYALSAMHLMSSASFSSIHKTDWLTFDGKTGFPIFVGQHSLGVLICFKALNDLKAREVRKHINAYLEEVFLGFISDEKTSSVQADLSGFDNLSLPDFALTEEPEFSFLLNNENRGEEVVGEEDKTDLSLFPLLLKKGKKEDLLKQAHELYLKTSSFAFLNTEDLNWKKGVFHEMKGVFVCVPFFHQLSDFQKKILIQDLLRDSLSCRLVMGIQEGEELPTEWKNLFCSVL